MRAPAAWTVRLAGQVFDLLEEGFPGFRRAEARARRAGGRWQEISRPFVREEDGVVVAHLGVAEMRLSVAGELRRGAAIHAVCTRTSHRGRGLFRGLMAEALAWADDRGLDLLLLTTATPELYARYGFEIFAEHRFDLRGRGGGRTAVLEPLCLEAGADRRRVAELLGRRSAVSSVLGVVGAHELFALHQGLRPLWWDEGAGVLYSWTLRRDRLDLWDVVFEDRPPPVDRIWRCLPEDVREMHLHFRPDRLEAEGAAARAVRPAGEVLMTRGPFLPTSMRAMLPMTARC